MYACMIAVITAAMWESIILTAAILLGGVGLVAFMLLVVTAGSKRS